MKVLIQEAANERFWKAPGVWVKDRAQAKVFEHTLQALDYCARFKLEQVRLVIACRDRDSDILVKLRAQSGEVPA
jgi:hypothetical protein